MTMKTVNLFEEFSSEDNLKRAFLYLQQEFNVSSLPIDPLWNAGLTAVNDLGDEFFRTLSSYVREGLYKPDLAGFVYADKDNSDVRPISVLTLIDRIIFQAILNPQILGNKLDKRLHSFCFGNRVEGDESYLCHYPEKWRQFCDNQIYALEEGFVWRLECDIRMFYEQIHLKELIRTLDRVFGVRDKALLSLLENQLSSWAENRELPLGIPQGPMASHVLANAYLHPVDMFINDLVGSNIKYYRYADDMVFMAKDADSITELVHRLAVELRSRNLRLNEKTKIERLDDATKIEEKKFYNDYGTVNECSRMKLERIAEDLPSTFHQIRQGADLPKIKFSELKYFLKAEAGGTDEFVVSGLVDLIRFKPSLIQYICNYLGVYFAAPYLGSAYMQDSNFVEKKYSEVFALFNEGVLSPWVKFWIFKILSASDFSKKDKAFIEKSLILFKRHESPFCMKVVSLFFNAFYQAELGIVGFNVDDLKKLIVKASRGAEESVYYYFLIFLKDAEDREIIVEMIGDALRSSSPEVQLIGMFLAKHYEMDTAGEEIGNFAKIYFGLPFKKVLPESEAPSDEYLAFDGKIPMNQLAKIYGFTGGKSVGKKKSKKSKTNHKPERVLDLLWDGFSVTEVGGSEETVLCRKGFPQKLFSECFRDVDRPTRQINRESLQMTPKQIKSAIKSLVTHWSSKFGVSRESIETIINYDIETAVVNIAPNLRWKKVGL